MTSWRHMSLDSNEFSARVDARLDQTRKKLDHIERGPHLIVLWLSNQTLKGVHLCVIWTESSENYHVFIWLNMFFFIRWRSAQRIIAICTIIGVRQRAVSHFHYARKQKEKQEFNSQQRQTAAVKLENKQVTDEPLGLCSGWVVFGKS